MKASEAKVFSSGISSVLSPKRRNDISYSRLNQMDDSVEFSSVPFRKTTSCCVLSFALVFWLCCF